MKSVKMIDETTVLIYQQINQLEVEIDEKKQERTKLKKLYQIFGKLRGALRKQSSHLIKKYSQELEEFNKYNPGISEQSE